MLSFIKFGPGGIRTHDQRIMSPLRYRCATGPWRFIFSFHALGAALAGKLRFLRYLSSPQKILNLLRRQSATGPWRFYSVFK